MSLSKYFWVIMLQNFVLTNIYSPFKIQLNNDSADSHFYSQELGDDFENCIMGSFKMVIIGFLFLLFFFKFSKTKHGINFGYGLKLLIIGEQVIY